MRRSSIENALFWIHECHIDGLRLDMRHAIYDFPSHHMPAGLSERVRAVQPDRRVLLNAEDPGNATWLVSEPARGSYELDAVWSEDFYHSLVRLLTGESAAYYCDFAARASKLATLGKLGRLFTGQHSRYYGGPRGSSPGNVQSSRLICYVENHDQVGNRPFGKRLNCRIAAASYRAAVSLLLCLPFTPLLFIGQEWGASTRFFFADQEEALGRRVAEGRERFFRWFAQFQAMKP